MTTNSDRIVSLLAEAKKLAKEYRHLTGRPLGITGEIAEYEAARILGLELSSVRQAAFDAIRQVQGHSQRVQIKGRCLLDDSRPGQRLGGIRLDKEWDVVMMVLMDSNFDAVEIHEASREAVTSALLEPGSKARNERGALALSKFKSIGTRIWPREQTPAIGEPCAAHQKPSRPGPGQNRLTGAAGNESAMKPRRRSPTRLTRQCSEGTATKPCGNTAE